ncbi:MAG TPA: hypothetical protein VIW45_00245 [Vicinamibacterales bacterium]|jgi:hypothetical protein
MVPALALTLALAQQSIPVAGRIVVGNPAAVELTNNASQAVTAWSFVVVSPNAQGGMHREVHTADVYLSEVTRDLPRAQQHLDWVQPGRSVRVPIDAAPANASVEIVAVVFADRTAAGDPKTIQTFFDHRRAERDQLRDVSETLNGVLKTEHGVAALRALEQRLASVPASDDNLPLRSAREAVTTYLAQAGGPQGDRSADEQIRQYAAFVAKQYALAAAHANRKP